MTPKIGSCAHRAIDLIRERGAARTTWLSEQLGSDASNISAALDPYCKNGTLVVCKVERLGARPENEYRLGLAGPGHAMGHVPVAHNGAAPVVRRPTIDAPSRLHLDAEEAKRRASAPPPPAAVARPEAIPAPAPTPAAARSAPAPAPTIDRWSFRVALANDATLFLWIPGQTQPVDLAPDQTRALVDYLRKLGAFPSSIDTEAEMPVLLQTQAQ